MLHPVIESLLFLKLTRQSVCESIDASSIEEKEELKDYIQNEASDYEIIHLVTLGEMPEEKFDNEAEEAVWECFQKDMVKSFDYFVEEGFDEEDINRIIFEMGPISQLGLSSAQPIMELHQHNGFFKEVIEEKEGSIGALKRGWRTGRGKATTVDKLRNTRDKIAAKWVVNSSKRRIKQKVGAGSAMDKVKTGAEDAAIKGYNKMQNMTPGQKAGAKGVGAAAAGAGAAYLAYKAWKKRKAEKAKKKK